MWLFREDTATLLQHVAIPIEFLGLTLAVIEGMRPDWARKTEEWFNHVQNSDTSRRYLHRATIISVVAGFFATLFCLLFWLALMFYLWNGPLRDQPSISAIFGAITLLCILVTGCFFGTMAPQLLWTKFLTLRKWTDGRALGAIGLCLASVGFSTEIYQVLTMYLAAGATRPDWSWLPWIW